MIRLAGARLLVSMIVIAALHAPSLYAAQFQGFFGLGYDHGGEIIAQGTYVGGNSWEVRANSGLLLR